MAADRTSHTADDKVWRLRGKIGRQRRQVDRRVDELLDRSLLTSVPREFVRRHPARSLLSAAGAGLLFGKVLGKRGRESLGHALVQLGLERAWPRVISEFNAWRKQRRNETGETIVER